VSLGCSVGFIFMGHIFALLINIQTFKSRKII
jgi:hypothetical protein